MKQIPQAMLDDLGFKTVVKGVWLGYMRCCIVHFVAGPQDRMNHGMFRGCYLCPTCAAQPLDAALTYIDECRYCEEPIMTCSVNYDPATGPAFEAFYQQAKRWPEQFIREHFPLPVLKPYTRLNPHPTSRNKPSWNR